LAFLNDLELNWSKSPISDLILGDSSCPEGYEYLINNTWPGTTYGCECTTSITRGHCKGSKKRSLSCFNVHPTDPRPLYVWDGKLICAKRLDRSYFEYAKSKEYCKSWMRSCGVIDSLNNILCVDNTQKCPLNKIVFAETNSIPIDYHYSTLYLGTKKSIYFTSEATENLIYVDIKVSEGEVCIDPGRKNSINGDTYILDKDFNEYYCANSLDGEFYDNRYTLLDSIPKTKYYFENNLTDFLVLLPYYPIQNITGYVNLYSRDYVGWNENKCDHSKINQWSGSISHHKRIEEWCIWFFWFVCICFIYIAVSNTGEFDQKKLKYGTFIDVLLLCFSIPTLFLSFYDKYNFYIMYESFESFIGKTCGDHIVNSLLWEIYKNVEENFIYSLIFIFFQVLIIFCAIFHILYKVYYEKKNDEVVNSEHLIEKTN